MNSTSLKNITLIAVFPDGTPQKLLDKFSKEKTIDKEMLITSGIKFLYRKNEWEII